MVTIIIFARAKWANKWIYLSPPSFLGTTPNPEQWRLRLVGRKYKDHPWGWLKILTIVFKVLNKLVNKLFLDEKTTVALSGRSGLCSLTGAVVQTFPLVWSTAGAHMIDVIDMNHYEVPAEYVWWWLHSGEAAVYDSRDWETTVMNLAYFQCKRRRALKAMNRFRAHISENW